MKLAQLFEVERKRRGISYREASREIGLSHTTLVQLKEGKPIEFETAVAICDWLGVPITAVAGLDENDQVFNVIATVMKTAPELKNVFAEAAREVEQGNITLTDFQQVVDFAAWIIQKRREEIKRGSNKATEGSSQDSL